MDSSPSFRLMWRINSSFGFSDDWNYPIGALAPGPYESMKGLHQ